MLGNENDNFDSDNIIFTIKDTILYVPIVTLAARDNQKLSKFLSKEFEILVYWNKYKTKTENKNTTNKYIYLVITLVCNKMLIVLTFMLFFSPYTNTQKS